MSGPLRRIQLKTWEQLTELANHDTIALRDYAFEVSREVLRLTDAVEFERIISGPVDGER